MANILNFDVAQVQHLVVRKGNTARFTVAMPETYDLTGATVNLKVYQKQTEALTIPCTSSGQNITVLIMPADLDDVLPTDTPQASGQPIAYKYELMVHYNNGDVLSHLVGNFIVNG